MTMNELFKEGNVRTRRFCPTYRSVNDPRVTDERIKKIMNLWGFEYFFHRHGGWVEGIGTTRSRRKIKQKLGKDQWGWNFKDEHGRWCSKFKNPQLDSHHIFVPLYSEGITKEDYDYFETHMDQVVCGDWEDITDDE